MSVRLGNAPVSWGIFEFDGMAARYPFEQVLDEIAASGYQGTELGPYGYLPTDPTRLKDELQKRGLKLLSAYVPLSNDPMQVGRLLQALGADKIVLADDNGSVPELVARAGQRSGSHLSSQEWLEYGQTVEDLRRRLQDELGLEAVFHHHCAGCVETPDETRRLLENSQIALCLDTGHWHYAGGDAVQCLREFGDRVRYLHFKDCHPQIAARCRQEKLDYFSAVQQGVFCPLGEGEVDFPGVLAELQDYDGGAVVEQDVLVDDLDAPRRFAQRNREYLRGLGL